MVIKVKNFLNFRLNEYKTFDGFFNMCLVLKISRGPREEIFG